MAGVKLWLVISVACLVQGQAHPDPALSKDAPHRKKIDAPGSCNFFDVVDSSPLAANIETLKMQILDSISFVEAFTLDLAGQTDRLPTIVTSIKSVGSHALKVVKNFMEAIERMASDRTVPVPELLKLFEKPYKNLKKFSPEFFEPFINEIREHMGCTVAYEVQTIAKGILHQANQIATIIERLEKVVKDSCRRQKDMVQLVRVLSNRVEKISAIVTEAQTLAVNAVDGISQAADLLITVDIARNSTKDMIKLNRDALRQIAALIRDSALTNYISGLEFIKTNFSTSIHKLAVFDTSRKLSKLANEFDHGYVHLFKFLQEQNSTGITDIKQYYRRIVKNIEASAKIVSEKFLDSASRTALKLVDIVLERGPDSDQCFAQFTPQVMMPFSALSERIFACTTMEQPRWTAVVATVKSSIDLLNITYDQLVMNIAGCATFTNFATDSSHYLQAKACLKTNREDFNHTVKILQPQLEAINNAIKLDVDVSKFRVENCLANFLHDSVAQMKVTRTLIERCAGRIDDCPRRNRDDDENDWYNRYNLRSGFVDESDEATSAENVNVRLYKNDFKQENFEEEVSYEINSEEETVNDEQTVQDPNSEVVTEVVV